MQQASLLKQSKIVRVDSDMNEYDVFGVERRSSVKNRTNTQHLEGKITFLSGDLTDQNSLLRVLKESDPDEVYNLASQMKLINVSSTLSGGGAGSGRPTGHVAGRHGR